MSRKPVFDPYEARGILKVFAVVGQALGEEPESEEPEEVLEEVPEEPLEPPRSESSGHEAPRQADSEPSPESSVQPCGDLAAMRLFALTDRAQQGKVVGPPAEPPPVGPPRAEISPVEPPPAVSPVVAQWEPMRQRSADPQGESPGVPEPNPCCLAFVSSGAGQLAQWLQVQLASAYTSNV